ncbi:hypothetical protein E2C01_003718 [Portunus trituberculatus]|uniref:Uncharacterized protein n=1 Tax=Portunus trituberculatus TaxID=210409 RepID=A0A5B7CPE3_PORTR|nr:hypothetical protein [Portunus trituberculatus]
MTGCFKVLLHLSACCCRNASSCAASCILIIVHLGHATPGKLLETLKNNGVGGGGGEGGGEPPTPPHTPQRENINIATSEGIAIRPPPPPLDPLQQQALQARHSEGSAPSTLSPSSPYRLMYTSHRCVTAPASRVRSTA